MKLRKLVNSILVLALMAAVLGVAAVLIKAADKRMMEHARPTTESTGTESITTYRFENGSLIGRVSALGVAGAAGSVPAGLQGSFNAVLANGLNRAVRIRDVQAVTRSGGQSLKDFRFSLEKARLAPGEQHVFSGTVPVSPEFFNKIIRRHDMALRVALDVGVLELPLGVYTLEVEPALEAGLLTTNQVRFGEAEGTINFLNCEQSASDQVCEPMLKRMGAP